MNLLDLVTIENLWGRNDPIQIKFDRKFNFLVGRNGSGKTTVINLIAAALTADFEKLDKMEFSKVSIIFKPTSGSKKPSIDIKKQKRDDIPFCQINYEFRNSQKDKPITFDLGNLEHERFYRGLPPRSQRERMFRDHYLDIRKQLESFVSVCWLSVHRYNDDNRPGEDRRPIPAIDQKLISLNNILVRYFSSLTKKYSDNIIEFQKKTLISVLTPEKSDALIVFSNSINIDNEKKALTGIFEVLGVEEKQYAQKIKTHFEKFQQAIKVKDDKKSLTIEHFTYIYNTWRSHSLVQDYEELQSKKGEIFKPRDDFLDEINKLFDGRKRVSLSDKNELNYTLANNNPIQPEELSSGEKQLLIILGEALLQQGEPYVYITDEPELSLHVSWQETLTSSITRLNPNAQIIFATHSPDIVAGNSNKIINMENYFK